MACQVIEYMFPSSVNLKRVNWTARSDYEYVANWKLVQEAFNKNSISRYVDVDKLVRGKYQDNLEFMQWLKAFFDQQGVEREVRRVATYICNVLVANTTSNATRYARRRSTTPSLLGARGKVAKRPALCSVGLRVPPSSSPQTATRLPPRVPPRSPPQPLGRR